MCHLRPFACGAVIRGKKQQNLTGIMAVMGNGDACIMKGKISLANARCDLCFCQT